MYQEIACLPGFVLLFTHFRDLPSGELQIYDPTTRRFAVAEASEENEQFQIRSANRQPSLGLRGAEELLADVVGEGTNYLERYRDLLVKSQSASKDGRYVKAEVVAFDTRSTRFSGLSFETLHQQIEAAWEHHLRTRSNK